MTAVAWLDLPKETDFSLANLPLGVFSVDNDRRRCTTRLGDTLVDLSVLEEAGLFDNIENLKAGVFAEATLNRFLEHPQPVWLAFRARLMDLLRVGGDPALQTNQALQVAAFFAVATATMHLPLTIGDYTDFYSSREHATNVGIMFRGPDNALQPNWLHLPVGYHGRSSTVVVSGTEVRRPMGQLQKDTDDPNQGSIYGPCRLLDFELEMAAVVGGPANALGEALTMDQAKSRIFGFMLMNDWSARDIQKWEYVPLGPFTAKNFCTTVSPWIVMTAALDDFVAPTSAGQQDPTPLDYLQDPTYSSYDVQLTVGIQSPAMKAPAIVSRSNFRNMYWNGAQQLVHHAVTGCIMKAGDLLGSGTISGSEEGSFGSMLELCWKGTREVPVADEVRKFLKDGDRVIMRGVCSKPGVGRIGFGECDGKILPALSEPAEQLPSIQDQLDRYYDLKLYGYWRSSSTWRVRTALAAKGLEYTTIPVDLMKGEHKSADYLTKNPLGQVPLLEFTDRLTGNQIFLAQSIAIIEFLDNGFPDRRRLIPTDHVDKAIALEMVEAINAFTQPLQNIFRLRKFEEKSEGKINAREEAKLANEEGLKALETLVKNHRQSRNPFGRYCMGTFSPSIVDACLVPQMYNARRFGVDVQAACPLLTEIEQLCLEHAWFKASHPSEQPDALKD